MEKICSKCKKTKDASEFSKDLSRKDGLLYICKLCVKQHYLDNDEKLKLSQKNYYSVNKNKVKIARKKYYLENKERIINYKHSYKRKTSLAKYNIFFDKLTVDEFPILHSDGIHLEVKCKYCGKYFIPTSMSIRHRMASLNGIFNGVNYLYCSEGCKESCPIFGQHKYPKGFKKVTAREVDPILRQMCFERDNWECQICGLSTEEVTLHCHHIEGYTQNPLLGNDIDNVITLCKPHHKEVHKLPGCNYHELKCNR